jgi:hypothetical protein
VKSVVRSIENGNEIAAAYDVLAGINEYGELVISIAIEICPFAV